MGINVDVLPNKLQFYLKPIPHKRHTSPEGSGLVVPSGCECPLSGTGQAQVLPLSFFRLFESSLIYRLSIVPSVAAGTGLAVVVPRLLYAVSYSNGSTRLCSVLGLSVVAAFWPV